MKKRLLITSIVMMLVVAVALSTATYAWFTSNRSVKADAVVLTAATMSDAAILITHNANGTEASNQITLTNAGTDTLYPATPLSDTAFTTFAPSGNDPEAPGYIANDISKIGGNFQNLLMGESGKYGAVTLSGTDVSFYKDTFYVFNKGFQAVTLTPAVTIYYNKDINMSAMAAQSVRVAIIERLPSDEVAIGSAITANMSTYVLKNIWEFNTEATETTYVHPTAYNALATYYSDDEGETEDSTVTALNFDEKKEEIYIASSKSTAKNAALGSSTVGQGYGVVEGTDTNAGTYTQNGVLFSSAAFSQIGTATSGNHIANEYTVVVWLEGWDVDCTNAITSGVFSVDVSFTAA